MELEYLQHIPELTKVPYTLDGWLRMCDRWFDVTQGLFDHLEDNVGVPTTLQTILSNAVTT
ncbi:unnamed protein product [Phytomonas sp. Hart1]|nr:unnamed protein product [Phytomonas sp. Hart1]|eukprot:CCW69620.1 unnamed protein product [Phytomonas sp. isolate Hart1]